DQIVVNGDVTVNGADLNLIDGFNPADGDRFTLIQNNGVNPVSGEFVGYPEGHVFTNFLGSGLNAYLTYLGGDGNDVVIHMVDSTPEITVPNNGAADQYTLEIVGGNFVLSETVSGTIISTFPVAAINGPLVIHGEDGQNDTLTIDLDTIDHTTDIQIEFRGGTGGNDELILERTGAVNSVGHVFTSASDGSIFLDGESQATITYTGLEPIDDQIVATDRTFSFTAAADETITLSNYVTVGETLIDSTLGESVNFVNPTGTVTIYTENALVIPIGDGADTINIEGVDAGFTANLTVIAGTNDTVTFLTNPTNVGTGNLDITAGSIALNAAITTSGNVSMNATNGSISGTSLVTATNADLRATGDVGASGTEVELAVDSLEANVTGSLYVDNTGAIN
ncbi:MAG TPA: hypothetical protein DCM07_08000, partial [Planctomycetaceae bacterium]|nr:hypothetical protein [Planctomycetaceae bacterium]